MSLNQELRDHAEITRLRAALDQVCTQYKALSADAEGLRVALAAETQRADREAAEVAVQVEARREIEVALASAERERDELGELHGQMVEAWSRAAAALVEAQARIARYESASVQNDAGWRERLAEAERERDAARAEIDSREAVFIGDGATIVALRADLAAARTEVLEQAASMVTAKAYIVQQEAALAAARDVIKGVADGPDCWTVSGKNARAFLERAALAEQPTNDELWAAIRGRDEKINKLVKALAESNKERGLLRVEAEGHDLDIEERGAELDRLRAALAEAEREKKFQTYRANSAEEGWAIDRKVLRESMDRAERAEADLILVKQYLKNTSEELGRRTDAFKRAEADLAGAGRERDELRAQATSLGRELDQTSEFKGRLQAALKRAEADLAAWVDMAYARGLGNPEETAFQLDGDGRQITKLKADLAAARETIRKLRLAENMTCVWQAYVEAMVAKGGGGESGPVEVVLAPTPDHPSGDQ